MKHVSSTPSATRPGGPSSSCCAAVSKASVELTDATAVSQPAVSQHLRVLRDAGLVTVRPEGTRRLYRVDLDGLAGLRAWVDGFWDDALAAFVAHAEGEARS